MATEAIEVAHRVGRLIEIRICAVLEVAEVRGLRERLRAIYASSPDRFLSVIDLREAVTLGRNQIAQPLLELFRESNPKIERTGILLGADALMAVQVESLIVNARHLGRRVFRNPEALVAFFAEVSTPAESQRLREFLAERPGSGVAVQPD